MENKIECSSMSTEDVVSIIKKGAFRDFNNAPLLPPSKEDIQTLNNNSSRVKIVAALSFSSVIFISQLVIFYEALAASYALGNIFFVLISAFVLTTTIISFLMINKSKATEKQMQSQELVWKGLDELLASDPVLTEYFRAVTKQGRNPYLFEIEGAKLFKENMEIKAGRMTFEGLRKS